ncbi:hypothetical protein ABTM50_21325, partial [Acinetobacter baumannii]
MEVGRKSFDNRLSIVTLYFLLGIGQAAVERETIFISLADHFMRPDAPSRLLVVSTLPWIYPARLVCRLRSVG